MGGLVIDIIAAYLYKSFARWIRFMRSSRWERKTAYVSEVLVLDPDWGCPSVKVQFRIGLNHDYGDGQDEIPFLFRWSARSYARRFSINTPISVRTNPGNT